MVKRRGIRSRQVGMREASANKPLMTHRKCTRWHQNRGRNSVPGKAWRIPTYWPYGVRCIGGVNLIWAFVRNLRTWQVILSYKRGCQEQIFLPPLLGEMDVVLAASPLAASPHFSSRRRVLVLTVFGPSRLPAARPTQSLVPTPTQRFHTSGDAGRLRLPETTQA